MASTLLLVLLTVGVPVEAYQQRLLLSPRISARRQGCVRCLASLQTPENNLQQQASSTTSLLVDSFPVDQDGAISQQSALLLPSDDPTTTGTTTTASYTRGLLTIGVCTLVFASLSPVMHAALSTGNHPPPVLLLNAVVSLVAFGSLLVASPWLESFLPPATTSATTTLLQRPASSTSSSTMAAAAAINDNNSWQYNPWCAGAELGLYKTCGTVANLYGLSLTTADHGAFLIQLTTLIVPVVQGVMGVPIPARIWQSIALALAGIALFTSDHTGGSSAVDAAVGLSSSMWGDALCVVAAGFYATYDLRLFVWGQRIAPRPLMTGKILVQAVLSVAVLLVGLGMTETFEWLGYADTWCTPTVLGLVAWSGVMVNMLVPFLQVGGQQAIGPTRSQTIYASQPLWAAIMAYVWLGETVGVAGLVGGGAFLAALLLAATAQPPADETKNMVEDMRELPAAHSKMD